MAEPSTPPAEPRTPPEQNGRPQNIAVAIAEVSERATVLVHEEIELAKAEVAEKVASLARGAVVGVAAGVFIVTALLFILVGCAWLLYYGLKIGGPFAYFWGFFIMAAILIVVGAIAGYGAARAFKAGSPPVPEIAIEQARKTVADTEAAVTGSLADAGATAVAGVPAEAGGTAVAGGPAEAGGTAEERKA